MTPRRSARSSVTGMTTTATPTRASPRSAQSKVTSLQTPSPKRRKSVGVKPGGAGGSAAPSSANGKKMSPRTVLGQRQDNSVPLETSSSPRKQFESNGKEKAMLSSQEDGRARENAPLTEQEKIHIKSLASLLKSDPRPSDNQLNAHSMFHRLHARSTARSSKRARMSNGEGDSSMSGLAEMQQLHRSTHAASSSLQPQNSELLLDWDAFKLWPEGMELEEQSLLDYFRRLKFIQIEQETKNLFVKFISDEEMEFYEPADVAALEREASELKGQLKERKELFRTERAALRDLAARFDEADQLRSDLELVEKLQGSIDDMELELARLRVVGGSSADVGSSNDLDHMAAVLDQSFSSSYDPENDNAGEDCPLPRLLFDPPRRGTLTQDELAKIGDRQNDAIVWLEDAKARLASEASEAKRELAKSHKALDRLMAERSQVERFVAELKEQQQQMASRKRRHGALAARDEEEERRVNLATLALYKRLVSLSSISSLDRLTLEVTLGVLLSKAAKELLSREGAQSRERRSPKKQSSPSKSKRENTDSAAVRFVVRFVDENSGRRLSAIEIRRPATVQALARSADVDEEGPRTQRSNEDDDECLLESFAPPGSLARMRIQEAIDSDHLALLLQEAITCVESLA